MGIEENLLRRPLREYRSQESRSNYAMNNLPAVRSEPLPDKNDFSNQPRYIKCLVFFTFPLYGTCRLGLKVTEVTINKTLELGTKVLDTYATVYNVCRSVYNAVAPRVWYGFIRPYVISPIQNYVVAPIVYISQYIYDVVSTICVVVFSTMCAVFLSLVQAWASYWGAMFG